MSDQVTGCWLAAPTRPQRRLVRLGFHVTPHERTSERQCDGSLAFSPGLQQVFLLLLLCSSGRVRFSCAPRIGVKQRAAVSGPATV